ncbi:uncharacterized protein HD556DRAFT_1429136 [Suillus plorans]|uniref:Wax synthase domain-containing protein n=1 Tax=Suillus plorans TaxID=116603 RepID=A0A9P7J6J4_9AGAM|nr:uncharacterized protein HD556DRAFT_1429136 [Suillus plorans]KAG1805020.1 hypothetical protein HD556DRAFT_1429136 [Suillus plorans]
MLPLLDGLRLPTTRVLLTTETFASRVLPPLAYSFPTAFLMLLPRTQPVRIALWPITAILAFRAATSLNISCIHINCHTVQLISQLSMFFIAARTFEWTRRNLLFRNLVLDTIDLVCNPRGCGWDWSQGLYIPPETHPTSSRLAFATSALSFSPETSGSVDGGTIFDDSLPTHPRYLRSSIIATLCAFTIYSLLQANYEITVVICVLYIPSLASVVASDIHFPRGKPTCSILWAYRGVMGAFLVSGFIHHLAVRPIDPSSEMWRMVLPFGMMGTGMVIERAVAGNKTGGWIGWMWTITGLLGGSSTLDSATPVR